MKVIGIIGLVCGDVSDSSLRRYVNIDIEFIKELDFFDWMSFVVLGISFVRLLLLLLLIVLV